ncbi:uncharacterized protein JCM10292_001842 [Rhodotorula paludigena]|uniref:uncharacterized protein n=1 Tax=Rhodotorula paludigena TaxID=86838 RepID=UPI0031801D05
MSVLPSYSAATRPIPPDAPEPSTSNSRPPPYSSVTPSVSTLAGALVPLQPLHLHLSLLRHFHALQQRLTSLPAPLRTTLFALVSPAARWRAFLRLAAYQLETWLARVCARDGSDGPGSAWERCVAALPVEAALVWYAWVAGSGEWRVYEEDVIRMWDRELRKKTIVGEWELRDFPLQDLVDHLEGRLSLLVLRRGQELWRDKMDGADWDAVDMLLDDNSAMQVECPWCGTSQSLPLFTPDHTGFCDAHFSVPCPSPSCRKPLTHHILGLSRLLDDCDAFRDLPRELVRERETSEAGWAKRRREEEERAVRRSLALSPSSCLSGRDLTTAALVTQDIVDALKPLRGSEGRLSDALGSLDEVEGVLQKKTQLPLAVIRFVLSRYTTSHPFSTDVALSAYRLTTTLFETLSAPGVDWLTTGWEHTKTGRKTLDAARRRYEMFLYVANDVARKGPLVPTVDIDFVWMTHMLEAGRYRRDSVDRAESLLDHSLATPSLASRHFSRLLQKWESAHRVPLSFLLSAQPAPRNPLRRLVPSSLRTAPAWSDGLENVPCEGATGPSGGGVVRVGEERSAAGGARAKGKDGEELVKAREERDGEAGVWAVERAEARFEGILGADPSIPPTAWNYYLHPRAYEPFRVVDGARLGPERDEDDEARDERLVAEHAEKVRRLEV